MTFRNWLGRTTRNFFAWCWYIIPPPPCLFMTDKIGCHVFLEAICLVHPLRCTDSLNLSRKSRRKEKLGKPKRRWVDNIDTNIKYYVTVWNWVIWVRIETNRGLLWVRQWTIAFHKGVRSCLLPEWILASKEMLFSLWGSYLCVL